MKIVKALSWKAKYDKDKQCITCAPLLLIDGDYGERQSQAVEVSHGIFKFYYNNEAYYADRKLNIVTYKGK